MITLQVTGQEPIIAKLEAIANVNVEETLDLAAAMVLDRMRKGFLAQIDPENLQPWKPSLAAMLRAESGRDGGTLFDTGNLFHSLQLYNEGPGTRAIGTDVEYAKYHQFGTKKLPPRRFVGISPETAELVIQMIQNTILSAVERA